MFPYFGGRVRAMLACVTIVVSLALAVGCSGTSHTPIARPGPAESVQHVGRDIIVSVSPNAALSVTVPGVGRVSGPRGAFTRPGTITIQQENAAFSLASGLQAAGTGIGIEFHGTALD